MPSSLWVNTAGVARRRFLKQQDIDPNYSLIGSSSFAVGPPQNARDGQVWVGTGVGANGENWMFRYNASSASTYKWEFIGGAPVFVHYDYPGVTSIGNSTFTNVPNLSLTTQRAGDYIFDAYVQIGAGDVGFWEYIAALSRNNSVTVYAGTEGSAYFGYPEMQTSTSVGYATIRGMYKVEGAAAGDTWQAIAWCNSTGTNNVHMSRMHVVPVRIK